MRSDRARRLPYLLNRPNAAREDFCAKKGELTRVERQIHLIIDAIKDELLALEARKSEPHAFILDWLMLSTHENRSTSKSKTRAT